jgi:hypothetical protein
MEEVTPDLRPIRLVVHDDLQRSRLTVFFRLLLAVPHILWVIVWGIAAFAVGFAAWLAVLIERRVPRVLHDFMAAYLRYATHVGAYLYLAANPYPRFNGRPGYPVDLEIDPPAEQGRWGGGFRLLLALPACLLALTLGGGAGSGSSGGGGFGFYAGMTATAAFLAWFVCVVQARAPRGVRDLVTYCLNYSAQTLGYVLLVTDRYPSSDPTLVEPPAELPEHPVRSVVTDPLARSRLTVLFRLLLALPHIVWLVLWSLVALLLSIVAWFVTLAIGRLPRPFHRFLAAWVRYTAHVSAFLYVVGGPFPGFAGAAGSYPVDIEIAPPERQHRLKTLFRFFLWLPAALLAGAYGTVLFAVAFLGWFYALFTGRMPGGLRDIGAAAIRYNAQSGAYLFLLTDHYPYSAPVLTPPRRDEQLELVPPEVAA